MNNLTNRLQKDTLGSLISGRIALAATISSTILLSGFFASSEAFAGGFQINEHSVSGLGRAYAGEAAMIDNAAAMARNPAAMSYYNSRNISVVGHYIAPDVDVVGSNVSPGTTFSDDANNSNIVPSAFLPSLFYVAPIDDKWAFGLALTTHFGLSSDYSSKFGAAEHGDEISLKTIYITPSVSYKVNEQLTLGLGVSYINADGDFKTSASTVATDRITFLEGSSVLSDGDVLKDMSGDGSGIGFNLGLMWQINEISRLGLRYMAASDIDTDASYRIFDSSLAVTPGNQGSIEGTGTFTLNLPEVIELAYSLRLTQRLSVAASLQQTAWSSFENIEIDDIVLKEIDWDDATRYSFGADYQLSSSVVLRGGFASDESPVSDENRTLAIPDTDKKIFALGATFELERGSLDAGISYIQGDSGDINETFITEDSSGTAYTVSEFAGEVEDLEAWIYSVGYNVTF